MNQKENLPLAGQLESRHFHAQEQMSTLVNYYKWILSFYKKYIGKRIWDAGAGTGIAANLYQDSAEFVLLTDFGEKNSLIAPSSSHHGQLPADRLCDKIRC